MVFLSWSDPLDPAGWVRILVVLGGGSPFMVTVWLDDERNPNDPKIQELFGAEPGMIWVKTADAAIARLKSNAVRWISLDHDLGTSATGYDVACWMEQRAYDGRLLRLNWSIHSANVAGARAMRQALENADRYWLERGSRESP